MMKTKITLIFILLLTVILTYGQSTEKVVNIPNYTKETRTIDGQTVPVYVVRDTILPTDSIYGTTRYLVEVIDSAEFVGNFVNAILNQREDVSRLASNSLLAEFSRNQLETDLLDAGLIDSNLVTTELTERANLDGEYTFYTADDPNGEVNATVYTAFISNDSIFWDRSALVQGDTILAYTFEVWSTRQLDLTAQIGNTVNLSGSVYVIDRRPLIKLFGRLDGGQYLYIESR